MIWPVQKQVEVSLASSKTENYNSKDELLCRWFHFFGKNYLSFKVRF